MRRVQTTGIRENAQPNDTSWITHTQDTQLRVCVCFVSTLAPRVGRRKSSFCCCFQMRTENLRAKYAAANPKSTWAQCGFLSFDF